MFLSINTFNSIQVILPLLWGMKRQEEGQHKWERERENKEDSLVDENGTEQKKTKVKRQRGMAVLLWQYLADLHSIRRYPTWRYMQIGAAI